MKAQFKYAFLSGLHIRGYVFAVIFAMNVIFLTLGSLDRLPLAARITAVALGGIAIAVMMAFNIIGDVAIIRNMFSAPRAYLFMLTSTPRWKTLFTSIIAMAVMDIVSMTFVITTQVWLSLNLAGTAVINTVWNSIVKAEISFIGIVIWGALLIIAGYLLLLNVIMFCVTANKSIFYKKPAAGLLTFLLGCGCFYLISLMTIVMAPFADIQMYRMFIILNLSDAALPWYALLSLLQAAGLFVLTSKLMERRINI